MQDKTMILCDNFAFFCLMLIFLLSGCGGGVDNQSVASQSGTNTSPIAVAGADQTVTPGTIVYLDGSNSSDVDGDSLSYRWFLSIVPEGSSVVLTGENTANPSFVADRTGNFQVSLVVSDGMVDSAIDTVHITFANYINDYSMSFNWISAGSFSMGSPVGEVGRDLYNIDENQFQVVLSQDYYLMTTEVTQGQWQAVMGTNPSYHGACGDDCPVENVSWNDVQLFISALNGLTGQAYRLPTEAEWEYAARAGTLTATYGGNLASDGGMLSEDTVINDLAWYYSNSAKISSPSARETHPVGQKAPNPWGLFDMLGNVWEWTSDWYGEYPPETPMAPVTDPTGPDSGSHKVARGGGYNNGPAHVRAAYRYHDNLVDPYVDQGFRLVLPVD